MSVTLLLARHLLRTIARQRARTLVLWLALALGLGIIVGLFSFVSSIDDSFEDRGKAVSGLSDARIEAVAQSSLGTQLAERLERLPGTRYTVPVTRQRVTLSSRRTSVTATAFGIDRRAQSLRSAMQRELRVRFRGRAAQTGLTLSEELAGTLHVGKGDRIRLFAYQRTPRARVARVVDVPPSLGDVITLPRKRLERVRGTPGRPNTIYVRLDDGVGISRWEHRARRLLPAGANVLTPAEEQRELDQVLDFTVRSSTFVFGAVALLIAALLIYALQLMRMLERQEDVGLIRALGSRKTPLLLAEVLVLLVLLAAATPPGVLIGRPIARYLAGQMPSYLTDVFNFQMQVAVRPGVVAMAMALAFAAGLAATIAAFASTGRPVAEQLGRSPQAGATATAPISPGAAVAMLASGTASFVFSFLIADAGAYPLATVGLLIGVALATPGLVGLVVQLLGRSGGGTSQTALVARSTLKAYPRRAALAAAIMALGIAAMIPPQLVAHGLDKRTDRLTGILRPQAQRILASDDVFPSVPIRQEYARRALRGKRERARPPLSPELARAAGISPDRIAARARAVSAPLPRYAQPLAFNFLSYRGRRVEMLALDVSRARRILGSDQGLAGGLDTLRRHRKGVLISTELAAGTGLGRGDRIGLRTPSGVRGFEIAGTIEDVGWPTGTVYIDIARYRKLYRTRVVSTLAVDRRSRIDDRRLDDLRPLHLLSGRALARKMERQMDKSTDGFLAMRFLTLLAALVAVGGILATSVFARRREWGVLRAMGMPSSGLLKALALEVLLIIVVGALCGVVGGIASFSGPVLAFMDSQGFEIGGELLLSTLATIVAGAVIAGTVAVAIPTWLTTRTPLADALSYE